MADINVKKYPNGKVVVIRYPSKPGNKCYVIWTVNSKLEDITYYKTIKAAKAYITRRKKEGVKASNLELFRLK